MIISYQKCQSCSEAFSAVKDKTAGMLEKFQVKADIRDNGQDEIVASGKGFNLVANFRESELELNLKLSLLFRPLKGKIEQYLEKSIKRVI